MPEGFLTHANPPTRARVVSPAPRRRRIRLNPSVVEESSTRAGRSRRLVDRFEVLTEGTSTTSMATRAQSTAVLYGLPPPTGDVVDFHLFLLSRRSQPAAEDWPAPWTTMVELKSGSSDGGSKALLVVYGLEPVWKQMLSTSFPRWAGRRRSRPSKIDHNSRI